MENFKIIPAIDILKGKCVRLSQGKYDQETIYSDDPTEIAKNFASYNPPLLHLVDLDGAREGYPVNIKTIKEIIGSINIPVEVGGGIRSLETLDKIFNAGAESAIMGTIAVADEELIEMAVKEYPGKIIISIDAEDGFMTIKGWREKTAKKAVDFAKEVEALGIKKIIYTDIKRDGMLTGPNLEAVSEIAKSVSIPVIASGGISSIQDIENLKKLSHLGVEGVIIGKAFYSGEISPQELFI